MYWTRLDSTKFDQDKTRPNTIQIIPFGFYFAGQNPDLMMMENNAGTTTTTTMERGKGMFLLLSSEPKIIWEGEKKTKKTFLAGFSKEMPIYPKVHTKCSAVSHSASQSASFSLLFFVPDVSQRTSQPARPFLPPLSTSIHQSSPKGEGKRRWKEGRGKRRKERHPPTYQPDLAYIDHLIRNPEEEEEEEEAHSNRHRRRRPWLTWLGLAWLSALVSKLKRRDF